MRGVRSTAEGPRVVEVDEPSGDGVLLEVVTSSICGTDLGLLGMGPLEFTLGHEFAGLVDGVPFAVEPAISCGGCEECRVGHTQRCTGQHANLGIFVDGGLADRVRVPKENLVALPSGLDVADACLIEPGAVAWHGVRRAAIQSGERVVVVGGGSIGLLAAAAVRAMGYEVDLEARHEHQRCAGEALGAGRAHGRYDVVIEAAGSESGLQRCGELARAGGRIVLLGVYHDVAPIPGPMTLVKELTWVGAMAYERHHEVREVDEVAGLLARRPEIARILITHRFPLDDAAEAFRVAADRKAGAIKIVLEP